MYSPDASATLLGSPIISTISRFGPVGEMSRDGPDGAVSSLGLLGPLVASVQETNTIPATAMTARRESRNRMFSEGEETGVRLPPTSGTTIARIKLSKELVTAIAGRHLARYCRVTN